MSPEWTAPVFGVPADVLLAGVRQNPANLSRPAKKASLSLSSADRKSFPDAVAIRQISGRWDPAALSTSAVIAGLAPYPRTFSRPKGEDNAVSGACASYAQVFSTPAVLVWLFPSALDDMSGSFCESAGFASGTAKAGNQRRSQASPLPSP
jgi:hypothetical protein